MRLTMWAVRLMPLHFLGGGCITIFTEITFRPVSQVPAPFKYYQVSDQDPLVMPMHLPNLLPATTMVACF